MLRCLSALLLIFTIGAHAQDAVIWKTIELEWEKVDRAESYDVRLTPVNGGKAHQYSTQENHLSQEVPVGNYRLQIRSKARDTGDLSAWSPPSELEVAVKEIIPLHPEDKAVIDTKGGVKQPVIFKWSPVDKVREYTLRVWSDDKKETPWVFTGKQTSRTLAIPPGQVYYWQVLFESANDVLYAQEPKTFSFTLQGVQLLKPEIAEYRAGKDLAWTSPGAQAFKVKLYYRHLDDKDWIPLKEQTLKEDKWAVHDLKPRSYKLEVIATAPMRLNSAAAESEFTVKPTLAEVTAALNAAVQ